MIKHFLKLIIAFLIIATPCKSYAWGFYCHRLINKHAIFLLPPEMFSFYKKHMDYIVQHSIDPDKRSHGVEGEAEKHYIDIDHYGENPFELMPRQWRKAVEKYSEDTLKEYGILPWNIEWMMNRLTDAFKERNMDKIINVSANFGHYIADCNVPLHTTQYYDGRKLYQKGVHALWESRIPELIAEHFDFFIGRAGYIEKPLDRAWEMVEISHYQADSVINIFDSLLLKSDQSLIFVMEERNSVIAKRFSLAFCKLMEKEMRDMVYRKLISSIYNVASFWYTAWVNAGQPNLDLLEDKELSKEHKKELEELEYLWKHGSPKGRPNPE